MKKSIVAMLSITALAIVANADNADTLDRMTGTNFEGKQNGCGFFATTETEGGNFYWYASTNSAERGAQLGTYTNSQVYGVAYEGPRPAIAAQAETTNSCLLVDTEGERLFRAIGPRASYDEQGDDSSFTQFSIANTVYFDSLVQFTVNEDEAPTIQTGDKLAVWLQGGETTNLVITAGRLDDQGGLTETNYVISTSVASIEPGTWHRLTIEAFNPTANDSYGYVCFRVFIDGNVVSSEEGPGAFADFIALDSDGSEPTATASGYATARTLFPSLAKRGKDGNSGSISCVAFEGTGAVDDLTFTPNDPFGGVEPPPAVPGFVVNGKTNTYENVADFIAAFKAGQTLALPEGWSFNGGVIGPDGGEPYATVPTYYNVDATTGAISLNETVVRPVFGTKPASGEDPAVEPITVGADTVTLNITNGKAGLYYGVRKYTALGGASSDTWNPTAQAADGNVTLTVDKTENATAEFYQVIVNDVLPATPTP